MRATRNARAGFTLVEMMVATALTLFTMVILTQVFQQAIDFFRVTRAKGNMMDKLKGAGDMLRRDLAAPHFDGPYQAGLSGPYLSDQRLDRPGWMPPTGGFFRIWQEQVVPVNQYNPPLNAMATFYPQGSPPPVTIPDRPPVNQAAPTYNLTPFTDAEGIGVTRGTSHILHFTSRLSGQRQGDFFPVSTTNAGALFTDLPAHSNAQTGIYASRWAEIAYFMRENASRTPTGLRLHTLFRRVRPVIAGTATSNPNGTAFSQEFSQVPEFGGASTLNDLAMLTQPANRMGGQSQTIHFYRSNPFGGGQARPFAWEELGNTQLIGEDVLLTDVLSFEVRAFWIPHPATPDTATPGTIVTPAPGQISGLAAQLDYPFDDLPYPFTPGSPTFNATGRFMRNQNISQQNGRYRIFDTWSRTLLPNTDWNNPQPAAGAGGTQGYMTFAANQVPLRIRITMLQIRIKIWDQKTQQTRQITIVQEV